MNASSPSVLRSKPGAWPRFSAWVALAGLLHCVLLGMLSYLPFVRAVPIPVLLTPLTALFPVALTAILISKPTDEADPRADGARWAFSRWWPLLVLGFVVVGFLSALSGLDGQPVRHGGSYFLNDHGTLIPTDAEGYRQGLRLVQRIFTSIPAALFLFAYLTLKSSTRQ